MGRAASNAEVGLGGAPTLLAIISAFIVRAHVEVRGSTLASRRVLFHSERL